jgi:hypothetical protein
MGAARDPIAKQVGSTSSPEQIEERSRVAKLIAFGLPQRFARVPTHSVGVAHERRRSPRAALTLPLRLIRVDQAEEALPVSLVTRNISSSGIYFLSPRKIEPGTAIELEVGLVDRPLGHGNVRMLTAAHVIRTDPVETPGWHGVAATFDDFDFQRDDHLPGRYFQS